MSVIQLADGTKVIACVKRGQTLTESDKAILAEYVQFCRDRASENQRKAQRQPVAGSLQMIMPSYSTLPESMLAPSQVHEKFASRSLAGLRGLGCGCKSVDEDGSCWDPEPCGTTVSTGSNVASTDWFTDWWDTHQSSGSGSDSGLTPTQKAQLDAQILQGGFNIAKLLAVQPGTTLNANGAISQQNAGYPIQTLGAQVGTSGLGSSAVMIALIAAGVFVLSQQRGR